MMVLHPMGRMSARLMALGLLAAFLSAPARAQAPGPFKVTGRVVDAAGRPVEGSRLAEHWHTGEGPSKGRMEPFGGVVSGPDGSFSMELNTYGRDSALLVVDREQKTGAIAAIKGKGTNDPLTIKLEPLTRIHGVMTCKELGKPPTWANVYVFTPSGARFLQNSTQAAEFDFLLPAGDYKLWAYGTDVADLRKDIKVEPGAKELDLKALDFEATIIARHKGKEPPALHVTDARGAKKDVKLADYKGKWLVIDFWGFWCGPCVGRSLPAWIDFCEDHAADRDKFEVLAFHDRQAKDFEELDAKLVSIKASYWAGRDLPFPILLDHTGETVEKYGIRAFPTSILIDPDGKLVGEISEDYLEKKLPPVPQAMRAARSLDRNISVSFQEPTLEQALAIVAKAAKVPVKADPASLREADTTLKTKIPLQVSGLLSTRSALELALDPLGLSVRPTDEGLLVVRKPKAAEGPSLSKPQEGCAKRIGERLKAKSSFKLEGVTLEQLAQRFEQETTENFVLDPAGRMSGAINPKEVIRGEAKDEPLGDALGRILGPLGLRLEIRDEVVIIVRSRK